jgi:phosphopantetheine--protein transferase-like protein
VILGNIVRKVYGEDLDFSGISTFGELLSKLEANGVDVNGGGAEGGSDAKKTVKSGGAGVNASGTGKSGSLGGAYANPLAGGNVGSGVNANSGGYDVPGINPMAGGNVGTGVNASAVRGPQQIKFILPSCGIDIQEIDIFPECEDYWSESFYTSNFTDEEIAYCATADSPRSSFAARWCAKEALHKCSGKYFNIPLRDIQVAKNSDGSVRIEIWKNGKWAVIPASCSVSHSENYATAVVISAEGR